jgi:DNA-binding transcriptional ArsR family regulator
MSKAISVAQAVAEETRLQILHRLMEGPAAVAELVAEVGKSQSLVSNHLAVLKEANLVVFEHEGRKSIYRLANASVATLVESLAALSRNGDDSRVTPALARARTCYDHLAGALGVELYEWLIKAKALKADGDEVGLGAKGAEIFARLGVDVAGATKARRRFAMPCLDWTERKAHLGGSLGAALCHEFVARGWIARQPGTRAVTLTLSGAKNIRKLMT